jgi:hypothetical protein
MNSLFVQHEKSLCHRYSMGEISIARDPAPTLKEFEDELKATLRRDSAQPGGFLRPDAGKKKKKKMKFCIAESSREMDREAFSDARATTLMQDVRKAKLLIRFKTSFRRAGQLKTRRGILGQVSVPQGGAIKLREATMQALQQACTPGLHAPAAGKRRDDAGDGDGGGGAEDGCGRGRGGARDDGRFRFRMDRKMFRKLKKSIHFYCADAASEEQAAGKILRDGFLPEQLPALLDALLLVIKDRPHATRRITRRCWWKDPVLNAVLQICVWDRNSITTLIQYSTAFQLWFQQAINEMERNPVKSRRVKNLRMAKQRFESTQKPLGRFVLFFEAILGVAIRIHDCRSGREKRVATIFLRALDGEVALQAAMLADAGDESLMLTRLADDEAKMNPLSFPGKCNEYLHRCQVLFDADSRFCLESGYTQYMLQTLERTFTFQVAGQVKVIGGGVSDELIDRCLGRMQNWLVLAKATIQVEFPDFEFAQSLAVMERLVCLPPANLRSCRVEIEKQLQCIARTIKLDGRQLVREVDALTPQVGGGSQY